MNIIEVQKALGTLKDFEIVTEFSVGGLEWISFSKENKGKLLVISSQKITVVDCDNGQIKECSADYDEEELVAYCEEFPSEELSLSGQYGGELPSSSGKGEKISASTDENHIVTIIFSQAGAEDVMIYNSYAAYVYGFSYDGDYFVLADDGGIIILKRKSIQS